MSFLIFDIETGPRADAAEFIKPFSPPSNIVDPVKIELRRRDHVQDQLESAALNAMTCEVLAVGVKQGEDDPIIIDTGDERDTLREFWARWRNSGRNVNVVGFNCSGFDIPILVRRSYACGVPVPYDVCNAHRGRVYQSGRIIDLMMLWGCGEYGHRDSLRNICRLLGLGTKDADGGKYYHELRRTDPVAARAYVLNDVDLTYRLALRMGAIEAPKPTMVED